MDDAMVEAHADAVVHLLVGSDGEDTPVIEEERR
jgi:hypothetical protein